MLQMAADWLRRFAIRRRRYPDVVLPREDPLTVLNSILIAALRPHIDQRTLGDLAEFRQSLLNGFIAGELNAEQLQVLNETYATVWKTFNFPVLQGTSQYQWAAMLNTFCCLGPYFIPKYDTPGMNLMDIEAKDNTNHIAWNFGPLKNFAELAAILELARGQNTATTLDAAWVADDKLAGYLISLSEEFHFRAWALLEAEFLEITEHKSLAVARLTPEILKYVKK